MGVIIIKICGVISSLPAVILKANGTATLQAAAIKRIDVNASQWRDGRSHSGLW